MDPVRLGYFKRLPEKEYVEVSDYLAEMSDQVPDDFIDKQDSQLPWSNLAEQTAKTDHELKTGKLRYSLAISSVFAPDQKIWVKARVESFYKDGLIQGSVANTHDILPHPWLRKLCHDTQTLTVSEGVTLSRRDLKLLRLYVMRTPMKLIAVDLHLSIKGVEKAFTRIKNQYEQSLHGYLSTPKLMKHLTDTRLAEFLLVRDDWFDYTPSMRRIEL